MTRLRIAKNFFADLQSSRGLGDAAFVSACGVNKDRLKELMEGAEPTMREVTNIIVGFNLSDGIPMMTVPTHGVESRLASAGRAA